MSKLNDLDQELDIHTSKQLFNAYKRLRKNLSKSGCIPERDLKFLVKIALKHEEITQLRAAELLGCSLEDIWDDH